MGSQHGEDGKNRRAGRRLLWTGLAVAATGLLFAGIVAATAGEPPVMGDLNNDGIVTFDDIDPFVLAVHDPEAWCKQYHHDVHYLLRVADFDRDEEVGIDDIPGFAKVIVDNMPPPRGGGLAMSRIGTGPDLDVDSDNDMGTDPPDYADRDADEDLIEDDPFLTGKRIDIDAQDRTPAVLEFEATGQTELPDLTFRLTFGDEIEIAIPASYYGSEQSITSGTTYGYPYSNQYTHAILADMNGDGDVNSYDVDGFILALANPGSYEATYCQDAILTADMNGDWVLDSYDISGFNQAVTSGAEDPIPIHLLVEGHAVTAAQGETRIYAEADADGDEEFEPATEADAARVTAYDDGLPLAAGLGRPPAWSAGLRVSTFSTVNLRNGNLLTEIPIDAWPSFGPDMDFRLYHNSGSVSAPPPTAGTGFALPPGWSFSCAGQLIFHPDENNPTRITVVEDDGELNTFLWDDVAEEWVPPAGVHDTLEENANVPVPEPEAADEGLYSPNDYPDPAWVLTRKNQWRRIFDAQGRLLYHTDSSREHDGQGTGGLAMRVVRYPDDYQADPDLAGKIAWIRDMTICRRLDFHYDDDDRLETIREEDVLTRDWQFYYDETPDPDRLDHVELRYNPYADPECDDGTCEEIWQIYFTYDNDGRIDTISDKLDDGQVNNNPYEYDYDDDGRLYVVTDPALEQGDPADDPEPQTFTYEYVDSPEGFLTHYADRREKQWDLEFEIWGGLRNVEDPTSYERSFEYDDDRNLTDFTDERGKTWEATYDSSGNLLTVTDPLGHKWAGTYDSYNNVTSITPPLNNQGGSDTSKTVEFEYLDYYNEQQQLVADCTHLTTITEPDADGQGDDTAETVFEYYHSSAGVSRGNLKLVTDANDVPTKFTYHTHNGNLWKWIEGPDGVVASEYYPVQEEYTPDNGGNNTDTDQWNSGVTCPP